MYFSKRVTSFFLITLHLVSLVFRYPDTNGPHDSDGFAMQWLSFEIETNGQNPWIFSFFSYFGMYPFSYPFGVPTLLSITHQLTGTNIEISILLLCFIFSIIGINSLFMLSREFGNNAFSIIATLSFATAHYFVNYTFWSIAARGLFLVLVPLFFFLITRMINYKPKYIFILFFLYLTLVSTHRSVTYVFFTILIPFILYKLMTFISKFYFMKSFNQKNKVRFLFIPLLAIPFLISVYNISFYESIGVPVAKNWIEERYKGDILAPLLNVAFRYTTTHLLSIFSFLGVLYLLSKTYISDKEVLLLMILAISTPFLVDYEYFTPIFLPTICLLSGFGIYSIINFLDIRRRKNLPMFLLTIILVTSCMFEFHIRELNTHVSADRQNPVGIEGHGLNQETRNNALWIGQYIPPDSMVMDGLSTTEHSSLVHMTTMRQLDLIIKNEQYQDYIVVEKYSWFDLIFHLRPWYFFGGNVSTLSDTSFSHVASGYYLEGYYVSGPTIKLERDYVTIFKVEYIIHPPADLEYDSSGQNLVGIDQTPTFFVDLYKFNYKIYGNEIQNIFFFNSY